MERANDTAEVVSTKKGYDLWAKIYDSEDNCLIELESEHFNEMIGDPEGLAIADIGCGTGRWAIPLARQGGNVYALDFSEGMLSEARSKAGWERVKFLKGDLESNLPIKSSSFDRVICCLVIDHVKNLRGLFSEMRRICKPDGYIAVSVMHPALMLRGVQARFTDPDTGEKMRPESSSHQVSDYIMSALKSGLQIEHIFEYPVKEDLVKRSPRAEKYLGWLLLLLIRLRPSKTF